MTLAQIHEWFQLAAQAMFASVALGEWSFYECEEGPGCEWPRLDVCFSQPREVWFSAGSDPLSWDDPEDCGTIQCGSPEEAEALIALAGAETLGGVH